MVKKMDEASLDFNFWPSFSDLMLSLVLVLTLIIFLITAALSVGEDLEPIRYKQQSMVEALAHAYKVTPYQDGNDTVISLSNKKTKDIIIHNELDKQLLKFSDHVLFPSDIAMLSPRGRELLSVVGRTIKKQVGSLKEIQIQGHADTDQTKRFPSNLDLAAARAIEVYKYFQNSVGIDPAICLMSATTYGEFKPAARFREDSAFDRKLLFELNKNDSLKSINRRIEILLFYRR